MTDNKKATEHIINSLILYNSKYRLAICQPCGTALPCDIASHFRVYHKGLDMVERKTIVDYVKSLDTVEPKYIMEMLALDREVDSIEGLPIHKVLRCNICKILAAKSTMILHCRNEHGWTTSKGI